MLPFALLARSCSPKLRRHFAVRRTALARQLVDAAALCGAPHVEAILRLALSRMQRAESPAAVVACARVSLVPR